MRFLGVLGVCLSLMVPAAGKDLTPGRPAGVKTAVRESTANTIYAGLFAGGVALGALVFISANKNSASTSATSP